MAVYPRELAGYAPGRWWLPRFVGPLYYRRADEALAFHAIILQMT